MQYIERNITSSIEKYLNNFPATAIIGPRQCGKSTLAKYLVKKIPGSIYLDLEDPDDISKLEQPTLYLNQYNDRLICFDEIQRKPEIFSILRSVIDKTNRNSHFLILGSASPDLLKQSNETLAGRIIYQELAPFSLAEINQSQAKETFEKYWIRGGFPRSYLAEDNDISNKWRRSFIKTFLERDIPNMGIYYPPPTMERLWQMLAHIQGQVLNLSQLGNSLGISHTMVRNYLEVLQQTFMIRILNPYSGNLKKRLIKSPKVYIRDTGIFHTLLDINNIDNLFGNPAAGASWETIVIENILNVSEEFKASFLRTSNGMEIDLILEKGLKKYAIECKFSSAPKLSSGFYNLIDELNIDHAWVVAPISGSFPIRKNVTVTSLNQIIEEIRGIE